MTQALKERQITFTYDNNGNQTSMADAVGTTRRTYDEMNRIVTEYVPGIGSSTFKLDQKQGLAAGFHAEVITDPKGNVKTKVYDQIGRIKEVKDGSSSPVVYAYNNDGSRQSVTYPSGVKEEYTYFKNKQLKTLVNSHNSTVLDTYVYTYDNANNQTSKNETINGVVKGTTTYTYDTLNRLEKVVEPSGKKTEYAFNGSGNRISEKTSEARPYPSSPFRFITLLVTINTVKQFCIYYLDRGHVPHRRSNKVRLL